MYSLSRRTFISGSAAAAFVTALPRTMWADPLGIPPGIQLYTVGADLQKDMTGTLKQLSAIGYKTVESYHFPGYEPHSLRSALDNLGLKCPSAHLSMNDADLGPVFEEAHILGAHYAVSSTLRPNALPHQPAHKPASPSTRPPGGKEARPSLTADEYKKMAEHMNDIGRSAKQAGLQYAYHNHNAEFRDLGDGTIGYDILLNETDPELVKFELDCGWMVVSGHDPVHYFQRYPNRYRMLHIKDFVKGSQISTSTQGPTRPVGTELGRGEVDYKPIFAAAKKAGIVYYFVEQEPPFLDMTPLEAAKVDYEYLHAL